MKEKLKKPWLALIPFIFFSLWFSIWVTLSEFQVLMFSLLFAFLISSIAYVWLFMDEIIKFVLSKRFSHLMGHLFHYVLIVFIIIVINLFIVKNDYYLDLTMNKLHSLSTQSLNALKLLSGRKVKFELFASRSSWGRYHNLLKLYKHANPDIDLTFYDIDKELSKVGLYKITEEGTLVISEGGKIWKGQATNELQVTSLLMKAFNPQKKKVYYTVGHNETSLNDKNKIGADFLREKIQNSNIETSSIELHKGIPKDTAALLILNPQIEFLDIELKYLKEYLVNGGSLILTMAPQFTGIVNENYTQLLENIGLKFNNIIILDRLSEQLGAQASIPIVNKFEPHKITEQFQERALFPLSASWTTSDGIFKWKTLAKSTPFPGSWGESNFEEIKLGKASYSENRDLKGPMPIMVIGQNDKSRIVAFSSNSFITNQFQGQTNNFNLFLNALSWAIGDENLITLDRPELKGNIVYLSQMQADLIFYFVVLIYPFLFFGVAIYMYRRQLGK